MGGYSRSFRGSLKGRRGAEGGKLVAPRPGGAKGQEEASALANGKRLNPYLGLGVGQVLLAGGREGRRLCSWGGMPMGDGGLTGLQAWDGGEERGEE